MLLDLLNVETKLSQKLFSPCSLSLIPKSSFIVIFSFGFQPLINCLCFLSISVEFILALLVPNIFRWVYKHLFIIQTNYFKWETKICLSLYLSLNSTTYTNIYKIFINKHIHTYNYISQKRY